jgi:hypothetical protein
MNRTGLLYGLVAATAVVAALFAGCLPDDLPGYTNGGKTVVAVASSGTAGQMLWTYDVASQKVAAHPLPDTGHLLSARMLGDEVWVAGAFPSNAERPAKEYSKFSCKRFDPVTNEFAATPEDLKGSDWLRDAMPASYEGKKCVFLQTNSATADPGKKLTYAVFSWPDMKKQKEIELDQVIPAGRFWWVEFKSRPVTDGKMWPREIVKLDLYDAEGKMVASIPKEESHKIGYDPGLWSREHARISDDSTVLLLASGGKSSYDFGVFEVSTGKFLWGGVAPRCLEGNPLVRRTEIWSLTHGEGGGIALVRYSPAEKPEDGRHEVIKYAIREYETCGQYTLSPEGSHFLLTLNGDAGHASRLLFIPIKEGVTEKDVRVVELKAAE